MPFPLNCKRCSKPFYGVYSSRSHKCPYCGKVNAIMPPRN